MKNQTYIRCPRCELNYILKKDKLCNVCKQEMRALGTLGQEESLDLEICPICKINYINPDEDMCIACAKEKALEDSLSNDKEDEVGWNSDYHDEIDYSTDDEETGDMVSITDLEDSPLDTEMEIDLGVDDIEDEKAVEEESDETFDGDFEDAFDDFDDADDDFDDEDDDEEEEIDDLDEDFGIKKKKSKKSKK